MTVLIVTRSDDNDSVETVSHAILDRGGSVFRFNTDQYPTNAALSIRTGDTPGTFTLRTDTGTIADDEVQSVWYRRFHAGACIPETMDPQLRKASILETRTTLFGWMNSLNAFLLDPLPLLNRAKNKQLQLELAREAGLHTPRTLTTNDADDVRAFARECADGVIAKMLSSFAIFDDQKREHVVFTNVLSDNDLQELDGLRYSPMTFQERVPKSLELRVTIVGERLFAAAIDSQASDRARNDWRRDGQALLQRWQKHDLPPDVTAGMMKLMDALGLNYGAADFVLTPDGRYVFLEVNPAGEFFWLDRYPGLPISEAIADVLTGHATRRSGGSDQLLMSHAK